MRPYYTPKGTLRMTDSKKQPSRRLIREKAIPQNSDTNTLCDDISIIRGDIAEIKDVLAAIQYELRQLRSELEESDDGSKAF
jgi:hypothetical protein